MSAVQPWVRHECDGKPMSRWWDLGRTAGSVAAWAGVATGAAAVGFATERYVMGRSWRGEDPYADEALGSLRGTSRKDRKSTRLNSSHVAISYAAFCSKKKKHTDAGTDPSTQTRS